MNMVDLQITVMTPTYNRAHTLSRVFESLCRQSCKNFEWLIVDDGSSDNTKDLVDSFKERAPFEILYFYKENGGRHTALNYSYDKIRTEWVLNIDSDDALTDNAIELVIDNILSIPEDKYGKVWLVSGRCIDSVTRTMVGKPWEDGINNYTGDELRRHIYRSPGEKSNCRKVAVLKEYKFPVFDDCKFVGENCIWEKVNDFYDQWCTNDVFRIYYQDSPDSLGAGKVHTTTKRKSQYRTSILLLNDCRKYLKLNKSMLSTFVHMVRYAVLSKTSIRKVWNDLNNFVDKLVAFVAYYPMLMMMKIIRMK